jgi:RING finger/CHY zinc finger protein 1
MQTSTMSISRLKCGHALHSKCIDDYLDQHNSIACPICRKSICDPSLFEEHFDKQIAETPMPHEYKDVKMKILCNDCLKKSEVCFHVIGGKCFDCKSYNTQRIQEDSDIEK